MKPITTEKVPIAQNMDEIIVDDGRNQNGDEDMFTKETSICTTCCVNLKEISDVHECRKCLQKFVDSVAMTVQMMDIRKWITYALFSLS